MFQESRIKTRNNGIRNQSSINGSLNTAFTKGCWIHEAQISKGMGRPLLPTSLVSRPRPIRLSGGKGVCKSLPRTYRTCFLVLSEWPRGSKALPTSAMKKTVHNQVRGLPEEVVPWLAEPQAFPRIRSDLVTSLLGLFNVVAGLDRSWCKRPSRSRPPATQWQ